MGAQHMNVQASDGVGTAQSFEDDLAAILGNSAGSGTSRPRGRRKTILTILPVALAMSVGIIAFVPRNEPPATALREPSRTGAALVARPVQIPRANPVAIASKPVGSAMMVDNVTPPDAGVPASKAQRARSNQNLTVAPVKRRAGVSQTSYRAPNETAMFAQADAPPAEEQRISEERDSRGDTDSDKQEKRAARLEALDAVRALRLR